MRLNKKLISTFLVFGMFIGLFVLMSNENTFSNNLNKENIISEKESYIIKPKVSDTSVDMIWNKTWGYTTSERRVSFDLDNESNLIAVGFKNNYEDIMIAKYNPDGVQLWEKIWDLNGHDEAFDVVLDKNNNIYIAGRTGTYGAPDKVALLLKLNSTGDEVWHREWSGANDYGAIAVALDSEENVYIMGTPDSDDIFLRKYNSTGALNWTETWGVMEQHRVVVYILIRTIISIYLVPRTR